MAELKMMVKTCLQDVNETTINISTIKEMLQEMYHSFINHSTCRLKVKGEENVLERCKVVNVNA
jgi:CII-binding regulator of phage lambda lysogenization HflD